MAAPEAVAPAPEGEAAAVPQITLETTVKLSGGSEIPLFGLGTWQAKAGDAKQACLTALRFGYRMIDTAQYYGNEAEVGAAVAEYVASGGAKPYLVTKLITSRMGAAGARAALRESLEKLGVKQVDLYLIHSPLNGKVIETWAEMCKLRSEGLCVAAGVSNFSVEHLEGLAAAGLPTPEVNQIELHAWLPQDETVAYCREHGIAVMGYCPLARCNRFTKKPKDDDKEDATANVDVATKAPPGPVTPSTIAAVAQAAEASEAQVALRWSLQKGYITIPKSTNEGRIRENAKAVAMFSGWIGGALSDEHMALLDECRKNECRASGSVQWMDEKWEDVKN